MKAFVRLSASTQEVQLMEMPIPAFGAKEVLIKVAAFGVGIHDRYYLPEGINFSYTIGIEGVGTVVEVGSEVNGVSVGEHMIYTTALQAQGGTWSEYTVAKSESLVKKPSTLTFEQAAAIPIAGKTALESMRELELKEGDTLFVAGASGAIGTFIIQLAKAQGVLVAASASASNQDYMKSLGADKTVDYRDKDWIQKVKEWSKGGVTAALAIQPGTEADSIQLVKENGLLITVSGYNTDLNSERGITIRQMGHKFFTTKELSELVEEVSKGKIKVIIEKKYSFENALKALEKVETRHASGKLVVVL